MTNDQLDTDAKKLRKSRYVGLITVKPWEDLNEWQRDVWRRRVQAGQS